MELSGGTGPTSRTTIRSRSRASPPSRVIRSSRTASSPSSTRTTSAGASSGATTPSIATRASPGSRPRWCTAVGGTLSSISAAACSTPLTRRTPSASCKGGRSPPGCPPRSGSTRRSKTTLEVARGSTNLDPTEGSASPLEAGRIGKGGISCSETRRRSPAAEGFAPSRSPGLPLGGGSPSPTAWLSRQSANRLP